ncbi:MAG TPA: carboxypeptidase-like regulatory domain-containing protein [Thermoanaerobaculia bacterium]|nr:carboxypeptidase-like regulatory domain-containing protein [Thermoanaerobaculia bacterium]
MLKSIVVAFLLAGSSIHAGTIELRVVRGTYSGSLTAHLGIADDEHEPRWIASRPMDDPKIVRFEALQAGTYVVAVRGDGPAQTLTSKVTIGAADERRVALTLPARTFEGHFTLGGAPLSGVDVALEHETWHWVARVAADKDGRVSIPIWDVGDFLVDLSGGPLFARVKLRTTLEPVPRPVLSVDLPSRRIRGVVVDEDGAPIANARVIVRVVREEITAPIGVVTDARGRFEYAGIEPGTHTLRVSAEGYLGPDPMTVEATAADSVIERRIVLQAGRTRLLQIVDGSQKPVAGATVLTVSGESVLARASSGADGQVRIATPRTSASVVWVIPPGGSLAMVRLDHDDRSEPARVVVVPEAKGALEIETLLDDGTPMPNIRFLLRYNGELLPPDVAPMLRRGGNVLLTDEDGHGELARIPPGTYELWPYSTDEEVESLVSSMTPDRAPVQVVVAEGRQRVTVRFQKRK